MSLPKKKLLIIAPTIPPNICGISGYAFHIVDKSKNDWESISYGVEYGIVKYADFEVDYWDTILRRIVQKKESDWDILLNFAPFSYNKFGLSISLIKLLNSAHSNGNRVFSLLHETWNGSHELKLHQRLRDYFVKFTLKKLSKISNKIGVVTKEQFQKIETISSVSKINYIPVGANIVPTTNIFNRTPGNWIVFGLAHTRYWALEANKDLIIEYIKRGLVNSIWSVGPVDNEFGKKELSFSNQFFGENVLTQKGPLESEEISTLLFTADAAIIGQSEDSIAKSGSFAALAAHKIPIICSFKSKRSELPFNCLFYADELLSNPQILSELQIRDERVEQLYKWYDKNKSWSAISIEIKNWMK